MNKLKNLLEEWISSKKESKTKNMLQEWVQSSK